MQKLVQQAKTVIAYVLLVEGYASKVRSAALNQKLSAERAENVTTYLEQQCGIPLTNMLAPGAMDTSKQVASDATTEGQAENRRVVVKILQNKGVAGTRLVFTYLSKGTVVFADTLNNIPTRKAQQCAFCAPGFHSARDGGEMYVTKLALPTIHKLIVGSLLLVTLGALPFLSLGRNKYETIEATAMGTGTQLGSVVNVSLEIYEFSTNADRQILVQAFEKGQNQGLVNALSRMKAVGHCSITGTLGYDVAYVKMIPTPTGRKIRFVTNRLLRFGEVYFDTQSTAYNLTAGEFDLNDQDKKKSTGVLYPLAQLAIAKDGELQIELNQNPWKLVDVLDWKGTPGVN